jgi:hypothetical protein
MKIPVRRGDTIEYLDRGMAERFYTVRDILNVDGQPLDLARSSNEVILLTEQPNDDWLPHALLRKKV